MHIKRSRIVELWFNRNALLYVFPIFSDECLRGIFLEFESYLHLLIESKSMKIFKPQNGLFQKYEVHPLKKTNIFLVILNSI